MAASASLVDPYKTSRVGAVQAEPAWLDLQAGVDKVIRLIQDASAQKVELLGFPEVFIPGYPWNIWTKDFAANSELMHTYMANSLRADSEEMLRIRIACKEANMTVVLGYSERDGASLYITQTVIGPDGNVLLHRRKIKPSGMERVVYGEGQGDSLNNVAQTPVGKVGCLNCAENIGPLARFYEYTLGCQIHVASWPTLFDSKHGGAHYSYGGPAAQMFTRCLAMEGQTFAMACHQIISPKGAERLQILGHPTVQVNGPGFAAIYGPDGDDLAEPLQGEGIVTADIQLHIIDYSKYLADRAGHYTRPDLHWLGVNTNPNPLVRHEQAGQPSIPTLLARFRPLSELVQATQAV